MPAFVFIWRRLDAQSIEVFEFAFVRALHPVADLPLVISTTPEHRPMWADLQVGDHFGRRKCGLANTETALWVLSFGCCRKDGPAAPSFGQSQGKDGRAYFCMIHVQCALTDVSKSHQDF
mmetsp:Transcript_71746/g.126332  ORF Transcript_71746/g.126332 Transcript_71746/m.126332 type:complete len:120 (-) Transcript_71746:1172-1531(-)